MSFQYDQYLDQHKANVKRGFDWIQENLPELLKGGFDYRQRAKERKQLKIQEKRRRLYFLKQKVIGVFFLVFTIFAIKLLDGDATIALLTVPLSLMMIFSKEKWWMDNYYFETERNERKKR